LRAPIEVLGKKDSKEMGIKLCQIIRKKLKKVSSKTDGYQFLGARPQTPWVGFAEFWVVYGFREAEQRFLLLFLEKEDVS
jgi:hypothetical protein